MKGIKFMITKNQTELVIQANGSTTRGMAHVAKIACAYGYVSVMVMGRKWL
jgi:hypothetical protein